MLTAIDRVHLKKGPWITNDGYEYNAVLIAAGVVLAEIGPGPMSLDAAFGDRLHRTRWAIAALITGATGAVGVQRYARRLAANSGQTEDSGGATPAAVHPSTTSRKQQAMAA
jgi:putative oxidoreductase